MKVLTRTLILLLISCLCLFLFNIPSTVLAYQPNDNFAGSDPEGQAALQIVLDQISLYVSFPSHERYSLHPGEETAGPNEDIHGIIIHRTHPQENWHSSITVFGCLNELEQLQADLLLELGSNGLQSRIENSFIINPVIIEGYGKALLEILFPPSFNPHQNTLMDFTPTLIRQPSDNTGEVDQWEWNNPQPQECSSDNDHDPSDDSPLGWVELKDSSSTPPDEDYLSGLDPESQKFFEELWQQTSLSKTTVVVILGIALILFLASKNFRPTVSY